MSNIDAPKVQILHANFWEHNTSIKSESIDLICTDPPYMKYSARGAGRVKDPLKVEGVFESYEDFVAFAEICQRVLKPSRHIYCWTQAGEPYINTWKALNEVGFFINQTLVWTKINYTKSGNYYQTYPSQTELCIFAERAASSTSERRALNGEVHSNLLSEFPSIPSERMTHPTQKPIKLMRFLVERSSQAGELVYDPFAGSGSTLFACLASDRRCIATEIVEEHVRKIEWNLQQKLM